MIWIKAVFPSLLTFWVIYQISKGTVYRPLRRFPHEWKHPTLDRWESPFAFWFIIGMQSLVCAYLWHRAVG